MPSSPSASPVQRPAAASPDPALQPRLQARRRRVRTIRLRVVGASAGTFLAVSGAVLLQLVTGHDPALAASATTTVASRSSAAAAVATPSAATSHSARRSVTTGRSGHSASSRSTGSGSAAVAGSPSPITSAAS